MLETQMSVWDTLVEIGLLKEKVLIDSDHDAKSIGGLGMCN